MSGHDDHERGCHHGHEHPEHPHHEDEGGPEGTDFLDLELSQMLAGMARGLAKEAAVEVLRRVPVEGAVVGRRTRPGGLRGGRRSTRGLLSGRAGGHPDSVRADRHRVPSLNPLDPRLTPVL